MRKDLLSVLILLMAMAMTTAGCCGKKDATSAPKEENAPAGTDQTAVEAEELDVVSESTPEGVTNHFFDAFFSGMDEKAWNLLTPDAQEATRETFVAQASDTIKWNITRVKKDGENAYVYVNVSDLNEDGDVASEELIFALRKSAEDSGSANAWGVAGFSAGDLIVNFEEKVLEKLDSETTEPARMSKNPESNVLQ